MSVKRFHPLVVSYNAVANFFQLAFGTRGGTGFNQQTLAYGVAPAWELNNGLHGILTITDNVAFVIAAPTLGGVAFSAVAPFTSMQGLCIRLTYRNTAGVAHGAGTFNAIFKTGTLPAVATANQRSIDFEWNGANFVEQFVNGRDVPN